MEKSECRLHPSFDLFFDIKDYGSLASAYLQLCNDKELMEALCKSHGVTLPIHNLPEERVDVMEWQPIETAPKDGTGMLTIRSNGHIAKGTWYDNPFGRKDTVIDTATGKWWSVTHWMPLPAPPVTP